MSPTRTKRVRLVLCWNAASVMLVSTLLVTAEAGGGKKPAAPGWAVLKVEFKGPDRIADPIPPPKGAKVATPPPNRTFEFGPDGGKVVQGGTPKETPYILIGRAPNVRAAAQEFKITDALGQNHGPASTYVFGANNRDTLVFRRTNWKDFGELYLEGPGEQKVPLSRFLPPEDQAAWKLHTAKLFANANAPDKAREMCEQLLKQYPRSRSAKPAQELLNTLKKKAG